MCVYLSIYQYKYMHVYACLYTFMYTHGCMYTHDIHIYMYTTFEGLKMKSKKIFETVVPSLVHLVSAFTYVYIYVHTYIHMYT